MADPSFIADLWDAAKQGGPFATMFTLVALFYINRERKQLLIEKAALLERTLSTLAVLGNGLEEIKNLIQFRGRQQP